MKECKEVRNKRQLRTAAHGDSASAPFHSRPAQPVSIVIIARSHVPLTTTAHYRPTHILLKHRRSQFVTSAHTAHSIPDYSILLLLLLRLLLVQDVSSARMLRL